ncbi:hypothetical protein QCA50_021036 [Cerrena zonata]|uniref:Uncharacterized protein n=1 Tax=Cerrena zonata TaxID=2478898 RepID=A0AAW0F882_9APHY
MLKLDNDMPDRAPHSAPSSTSILPWKAMIDGMIFHPTETPYEKEDSGATVEYTDCSRPDPKAGMTSPLHWGVVQDHDELTPACHHQSPPPNDCLGWGKMLIERNVVWLPARVDPVEFDAVFDVCDENVMRILHRRY